MHKGELSFPGNSQCCRSSSVPRCVALGWLVFAQFASAAIPATNDWPQFLGPNRNGAYGGNDLVLAWPKEGPPRVWSKKIGQGFSGPVVAEGRLILFHRVGDKETVESIDAITGKAQWKLDYPTHYRDDFGFDEGPRATPAIAENKVLTLGAEGMLLCLDFQTGAKLWSSDLKKQYSTPKGFFGMACSPLVEQGKVLLNIGGADGAGLVGLDATTGKLIWKATNDEASYSSPAAGNPGGHRRAFFFTRLGLVAINPQSGKVELEFPWRARLSASVNAATPLVIGNSVFISASYNTGAALLDVRSSPPKTLWSSDDALSNHYATSVHRDGFLYGFHGRQEEGPSLRCVELNTGRVKWSTESMRAGTVTLAGDRLLILFEDGRLVMAPAATDAFRALGQAQILSAGVRAYPAVARGFFYARSKSELVCVSLKESASP